MLLDFLDEAFDHHPGTGPTSWGRFAALPPRKRLGGRREIAITSGSHPTPSDHRLSRPVDLAKRTKALRIITWHCRARSVSCRTKSPAAPPLSLTFGRH